MELLVQIANSRLAELLESEAKLFALESAGVDNWEGYSDAMALLEEVENADD